MAGTGTAHLRPRDETLLRVEDLVVQFPLRDGQVVQAVSGISLDVRPGETLGLVGESGCGKSTTGRAILQLPAPTAGSVSLGDNELTALSGEALRAVRPRLQMILQDPISSMNPRRTVREIVGEGLDIWGEQDVRARVDEVLAAVGLDVAQIGDRRAHQFSGGQSQRICIARALVMRPDVLVCDEPVASLDVSVQAQILNLLEDLKARYGLSLVFIAHDLAVVKSISDRVVVMYLGKICEVAPADLLFARPQHPYTQVLLASIPVPDPRHPLSAERLTGELPSPVDPPSGCRFRTRCPLATERCAGEEPQLREVGEDHFVACHYPAELAGLSPAEAAR